MSVMQAPTFFLRLRAALLGLLLAAALPALAAPVLPADPTTASTSA